MLSNKLFDIFTSVRSDV